MSLLDDLLDVGEPEPEPQPRRGVTNRGRWLIRALLIAAAGTFFIELFVQIIAAQRVSYFFVFFGLLALQVLLAVLAWTRNPQLPETLRFGIASSQQAGQAPGRDGLALATQKWSRNMAFFGLQLGRDGEQFARTLQPRIALLVEERLRLRHGITTKSDPQRAREILGEPLWAMVTIRAKRPPSGRELAALVKQMEAV